jgi:hypothetical protein
MLQQFYNRLITLCSEEKAISNGLFYDLMSANYENPKFDSTRQFAFLRSDRKELLLVVVNFDNVEKEVNVYIPQHAFDFFGFENVGEGKLVPSLEKGEEIVFSEGDVSVRVGGNDGEIYKIK